MNMASWARQITAKVANQSDTIKGDVQNKTSEQRVKVTIEGQIFIDGRGECHWERVRGTTAICHASQTSRYSLGVGRRGSITPACPHVGL